MPLEQLLEKLKEKSGLSEEELNVKLQNKMDQLSGLISKEGAAHIVANELGIQLFEQTSGKVKVKDLLEGMRDLEVVGKVTRLFEVREFTTKDGRQGKVGSFILADETATIRVTAWNDQADMISKLKENETVLKINDAYLKTNQGRLELHLNDKSLVQLDPEGVTVEATTQQTTNYPKAQRKQISQLEDNQENIELLGTVVQIFDPRFYEVCPECGKRTKPQDNVYKCPVHNEITPAYAFLVSFVLDDGTDTIRITCFRNQATKLCSVTEQEILECREDPSKFEDTKTELLGQIIKVVGRTKKNEMFDRLECTAQLVFPDPDPKEELKTA